MRKKHQPGCPCCETSGPCTCDTEQIRLDITSNEVWKFSCGVIIDGQPCTYIQLDFDMTGTYYIGASMEETVTELWFYNTNGPQQCSDPTDPSKYCAAVRVEITTVECSLQVKYEIIVYWDPTGTLTTCPTPENLGDWVANVASYIHTSYPDWCVLNEEDLSAVGGGDACPAGVDLEINFQLLPVL